jgi:hypothetical protein
MCIACELGFWSMIDALPPETRERILREQEEAARVACEAPPAAQNLNPPESSESRE